MAQSLVIYASQDKQYAEAFIRAARIYQPEIAFNGLDNVGAFALDADAIGRYDAVIALLSPEALASPAISRVLEACARNGGQEFVAVMVLMRPVDVPPYLADKPRISAEHLSPQQLADRIFASADGGTAGEDIVASEAINEAERRREPGYFDDQTPIEDEPVGGYAPPPAPDTEVPAKEAPSYDWPAIEEERAAPSPWPAAEKQTPPDGRASRGDDGVPPPTPARDQPAAAPEPPSAQPPAPPAPAPREEAPATQAPAPSQVPSGYLDQVGGAASDRPQARGRHRLVEYLQFSAYHPNATPIETPQTLLVYTHLPQQIAQVQQDAGTFTELGSAPTVAQGQSLRKIARNVEITVEPHVEGVTFSPAQESFVWRGDWHRSLFRYTGAGAVAGTTAQGWIDIYAERVSPICTLEVTFSFHAGIANVALRVPHGIAVTGNAFDTVFISYSHRDQEAMRQARETYTKLGIAAYHDDQLESGDNYEQRLAGMIRAANVFHLLWSDASAQSIEVRKEWLLALASEKGERFIRPWYWQQPIAPLPPELAARKISFRYEHLRRRLLNPATWF